MYLNEKMTTKQVISDELVKRWLIKKLILLGKIYKNENDIDAVLNHWDIKSMKQAVKKSIPLSFSDLEYILLMIALHDKNKNDD